VSALRSIPPGVIAVTLGCVVSAYLAAACGGDSTGSSAPVATVTVSPNPVTVEAGATVQLTAVLEDSAGNELTGRAVSWSSDAGSVATVDGSGLVTGVSAGSAAISATSEGRTGSTALTVTAGPNGSPAQARLVAGHGWKSPYSYCFHRNRDNQWYALQDLIRAVGPAASVNALLGPVPPGIGAAARRPGPDDRILIAGGGGAGNVIAIADAVLLDLNTGASTGLDMVAARVYHTTTPLSPSRVLFAGGTNGTIGGTESVLSSAEIFDLAGEQFTATGSMGQARLRHAAAPLPDGRVLVTGGLVPEGGGPATIDVATAEIFDPATGSFAPTGDMTVTRFNHSAIALNDGRVLVLGGNGRQSAEVYDPASGTFSAVEDMQVVHGLGHRAVKLLDGRVLILGGDGGVIQPTAAAEIFDPATDEFTRISDMTTTRMLHFAVLMEDDGTVVIGGGQDATGEVLATAESYDPATGAFTPIEDMPLPGSEQNAVYVPR
jgi:hypothetical protein